MYFYPRSPCGERQDTVSAQDRPKEFLSTLSLRRATYDTYAKVLRVNISIHALLAESDNRYGRPVDVQLVFLSTLSLRRATTYLSILFQQYLNFYPRSPCGERQGNIHYMGVYEQISIHALLAESDERANRLPHAPPKISIHALLAESDPSSTRRLTNKMISIHALLAESDVSFMLYDTSSLIFLSTLSLRRATNVRPDIRQPCAISIHALLAESDQNRPRPSTGINDFYPRSPCGERLSIVGFGWNNNANFYPRSPCGERPSSTQCKL